MTNDRTSPEAQNLSKRDILHSAAEEITRLDVEKKADATHQRTDFKASTVFLTILFFVLIFALIARFAPRRQPAAAQPPAQPAHQSTN